MLIDSIDPNKDIREKALKRLEQLCLKSIETLRDIPELEEPTFEQHEWTKKRMKGRWS